MTPRDQNKLLDYGFTILRKRDFPRPGKTTKYEIFAKTPKNRTWHSFDYGFEGNEDRDHMIKVKCIDTKIIED